MSKASNSRPGISLFWICIAVIASTLLWFRLQLSFDLSAFFPQKTSLSHDILLEQMKDGPGSRLLVIGLSGADPDSLTEASNQLRDRLSGNEAFINVLNGEYEMEDVQIPAPLDQYYLLMASS
jgi:predicted exporter